MSIRLLIVIPDAAPIVATLEADRAVVLGRSPECDLVIAHGTVSSRHAALRGVSGAIEVCDLGSRWGTQRDTHRLEPHGWVKFGPTTTLWLGDVAITQILASDDEATLLIDAAASPPQRPDASAELWSVIAGPATEGAAQAAGASIASDGETRAARDAQDRTGEAPVHATEPAADDALRPSGGTSAVPPADPPVVPPPSGGTAPQASTRGNASRADAVIVGIGLLIAVAAGAAAIWLLL